METVNIAQAEPSVHRPANLPDRLRRLFGVDHAIVYSVLNAARGMIGGPLIALLITQHFSPVVQGYYYTFASLLALQVFAEMGLGTVLLQFACHEWAALKYQNECVAGRAENLARLASLIRFGARWYSVAGLLAVFGLMAGGYYFFGRDSKSEANWIWPWVCLCSVTGVKLFLTPFFSILEGCGQVRQVYGYRLFEGFATIGVAAAAIYCGAGLWTAVFVSLCAVATAVAFLGYRYRCFFSTILSAPAIAIVRWREEVLPMQWRIALGWASGYFAFQLFTPVIFHFKGAAIAGKMGLTLAIVNTIGGIASAWITTRTPWFGRLAATRDIAGMDDLARRTARDVLCVSAVGGLLLVGGLLVARVMAPVILDRMLDAYSLAALLFANIGLGVLSVAGPYLRAFKKEPLFGATLTYSASVGTMVILCATFGDARTVSIGYCVVVFAVGYPLTLRTFWRFREKILCA